MKIWDSVYLLLNSRMLDNFLNWQLECMIWASVYVLNLILYLRVFILCYWVYLTYKWNFIFSPPPHSAFLFIASHSFLLTYFLPSFFFKPSKLSCMDMLLNWAQHSLKWGITYNHPFQLSPSTPTTDVLCIITVYHVSFVLHVLGIV